MKRSTLLFGTFLFKEIDLSGIATPFRFEMNDRVSKELTSNSDEQQILEILIDLFTQHCNLAPPQGNYLIFR